MTELAPGAMEARSGAAHGMRLPGADTGPSHVAGRRARRVLVLLAGIWILNVFDLVFTITAHRIGGLRELNPLARLLLGAPAILVVFKSILVAAGSALLIVFRRRRLAEIGCWCVFAVYTVLAFIWMSYYAHHWP